MATAKKAAKAKTITHRAKLTAAKVLKIRSLAKAGKNQTELAKKFGVAPSNVSAIVTRRTWASI